MTKHVSETWCGLDLQASQLTEEQTVPISYAQAHKTVIYMLKCFGIAVTAKVQDCSLLQPITYRTKQTCSPRDAGQGSIS